MNHIFNRSDFDALATLFDPEAHYRGYTPNVKERPNGDARTDHGKRYLHVSLKNEPPEWAVRLLARAHLEACRIAERAGVPASWRPAIENGTLRVLYYPAGEGTEAHRDFDLFTVNCWRDPVGALQTLAGLTCGSPCECAYEDWQPGAPDWHVGELGEMAGMGVAHKHRVLGAPTEQRAIVYFASPAMRTVLDRPIVFQAVEGFPEVTVRTTGEWQIERTKRSRVYK